MDNFRIPDRVRLDADDRLDKAIEQRLIRIETRLTKLMRHFGLRSDGTTFANDRSLTETKDHQS